MAVPSGHDPTPDNADDHVPPERDVLDAPIDRPGPARVVSIIRPDDPGAGPASSEPDGRTARRGRNREAVIRALLDLIEEGRFDPATSVIAERAGVSHRSLFRYFDDLDDLVREAINIAFADAVEVGHIHRIGQGPLDQRIDDLIRSRIDVYIATNNSSRMVRYRAAEIGALDRAMIEIASLLRAQLQLQFALELDARVEDERDEILDAMMVMTDFTPYDIMRRMLGYDDERIARTWRRGFTALLA